MVELRGTAYKVSIKDLINSQHTKENENNYFVINNNKISRVNLLATIIAMPVKYSTYSQTLVDDGSGRIIIRNFDNLDFFKDLEIGDMILVIGKPREYNNEKYIIGEIIKKLENSKWFELRKRELSETTGEKEPEKEAAKESEKNYDDILHTISSLDSGEGVDFDRLVTEFKIDPNTLNYLLEKGEIFLSKPGKLRVLE